ncbi:saccharopine dehydrogenase [Loktanella sp. F6476L]|uniref:saccharopine dehydrogenase n=1 Tax=Loktanella sp. F6476L TaxID=2926405 RepID=UPI001FF1F4F2|nr:saccharopine dehydrogenase [Loktanella sp. F6476L]MCK0121846.1 saccharopine dehydrogenase [Loktanella sp. F6476L]
MTHIWLRAEPRAHETRVGLTPDGAARMIAAGYKITVEDSDDRCIPTAEYVTAGCATAAAGSWPDAPDDAIIFGLKELPEDGTPLRHRHIMFGHAYKGQPSGRVLLDRFQAGGGTLFDLEYLVDPDGRRIAAFGYWAGYAGAAMSLLAWAAQQDGGVQVDVQGVKDAQDLQDRIKPALAGHTPSTLIIGALGRVGTGAADLCHALGLRVVGWDMAETASGGPFPEVLQHDIFLNCILARPGTPVFVPATTPTDERKLTVIGDIACDPDSDFSPIKVYDQATTWAAPNLRVHDEPPLDVMAIDNLPSLLPRESSEDFAGQLLPHLLGLDDLGQGVWGRAKATFDENIS